MRSFFLLLLAVAVSMLVMPVARRLAPHLGMVDLPDPRKVHREPIPRVGGWGIALGALLPLLMLDPIEPALRAYLAGGILLFAFGIWDDARQISHWPKFLGQAIGAGIVVFYGDLYVTRLPFIDGEAFSPLTGQLFTIVAMIGVINAINHSDGLDGLAGGETLLSLVAICFLGHLAGNGLVTNIALAVTGGIIGFLRFNTHPAMVFMGDSGSQFLGFTLAFLVVYLAQVANSASSAALPLLLIGLPLADILAVFYLRMRGGMNWFKATRNHVHHRLLDLGFSHFQSVVVIYSLQVVLVTCGVLLRYASDWAVVLLYFGAIAALFTLLALAEHSGWKLVPKTWPQLESVSAWIAGLRANSRLQKVFAWLIAGTVSVLMVFGVVRSGAVPWDFGVTAALAALLTLIAAAWHSRWQALALRAISYVTVVFATYLLTAQPDLVGAGLLQGFGIAIMVLAAMLGLFVWFVSDRRFGATPTDYLFAFALIAMFVFGALAGRGFIANASLSFISFSIVLFYGCEVVIGHLQRWRPVLGSAALATLLVVAWRGLATGM